MMHMLSARKMTTFTYHMLLTAFAILLSGTASGSPAHEHGTANLQLSIEGNSLEISLDAPLDNLLGFEHSPVDAAERQQVILMAKKLRLVQALFITTPAALCHSEGISISSPVLAPEMLGEHGTAGKVDHQEPPGHSDLDADLKFRCERPDLLHDVKVMLFSAFPRFRLIRVQAVVQDGQHYAELTPERARFDWKP